MMKKFILALAAVFLSRDPQDPRDPKAYENEKVHDYKPWELITIYLLGIAVAVMLYYFPAR